MLVDSFQSASFRTDTKFNYSLELGEDLRAGTVSRVSERSYNTTICPISITGTSLLHILAILCFRSLLREFQI